MEAGHFPSFRAAFAGACAKLRALSLGNAAPADRNPVAHVAAHPELHTSLLRQLLDSPDGDHDTIMALFREYRDRHELRRGKASGEDDGYPAIDGVDEEPGCAVDEPAESPEEGSWLSEGSAPSSDTDGDELLGEELEDALLDWEHADRQAIRRQVRAGIVPGNLQEALQEVRMRWQAEQEVIPDEKSELEDEAAEVELAARRQLDEIQGALELLGTPGIAAPKHASPVPHGFPAKLASGDPLDEPPGSFTVAPPRVAPPRDAPRNPSSPGAPATKKRRLDAYEAPFDRVAEELEDVSVRLDELEALAERKTIDAATVIREIQLLGELCAQKLRKKGGGEDDVRPGRPSPVQGLPGEAEIDFEAIGKMFSGCEQTLRDAYETALRAHGASLGGAPEEIARVSGETKAVLQNVRQRIASVIDATPRLKRVRDEGEAIIETCAEQASAERIIPERAFRGLCEGILLGAPRKEDPDGMRPDELCLSAEATEALLEASEAYLVELLGQAHLASVHAERSLLTPADIRLVRRLRGEHC